MKIIQTIRNTYPRPTPIRTKKILVVLNRVSLIELNSISTYSYRRWKKIFLKTKSNNVIAPVGTYKNLHKG